MRRILLVDDEDYILELLQEIIDWEFYGFQIIGTAENAREAMKIFYREAPDIIITDICMDDISGIEFITRIRLQNSTAKIIILSAYDKFEYAQKAMKLDVDGYLLKPINKEELLSTLLEVQKKLESKNEYQDQIRYLQSSLSNLQRKYLEEQLIWIYKNGTKSEAVDIEMPGFWAVASIQTIVRNEIVFLERQIKNLAGVEAFTLFVGDGLFALLLYSSNQNGNQIKAALEQIKKKYCDDEKSVLCGVSNTDECKELSQICENSRRALNLLFYKNTKHYITNAVIKNMVQSSRREELNQEQFLLWIANNELDRCREHFQEYLKRCADRNEDKNNVDQYFNQCAYTIKSYVQEKGSITEIEKLIQDASLALRSTEVYDLFDHCLKLIDGDSFHLKKTGIIIANAQDYIRNNCYDEKFSVDLLAEYLNISKSYLSKLYKDETKESIWNYVIRVRITKAREMLVNTNATNYEITKAIGYASEYHFSRAFSKIVGVSPSTYKKLYLQKK